jgi:hypothetical protein
MSQYKAEKTLESKNTYKCNYIYFPLKILTELELGSLGFNTQLFFNNVVFVSIMMYLLAN